MIRLRVADSPIEGVGVFAAETIEAGETVLVLDTSRELTPEEPLRPEEGEREDHLAYLADERAYLLPEPERRLNHSCDPNAYLRTEDDRVCLVARRSIEGGEEITIDYLINTDGGSAWRCSCGADRCRDRLETSFFELPPRFQREYLPLLEDWFVDEHRERVEKLRERLITGAP